MLSKRTLDNPGESSSNRSKRPRPPKRIEEELDDDLPLSVGLLGVADDKNEEAIKVEVIENENENQNEVEIKEEAVEEFEEDDDDFYLGENDPDAFVEEIGKRVF